MSEHTSEHTSGHTSEHTSGHTSEHTSGHTSGHTSDCICGRTEEDPKTFGDVPLKPLAECSFVAVDTSSKYLTVLVKKGEKSVLRFTPECAMRHSVILMDELDAAFTETGMTPQDADFFVAVTGPGSFTGIRIGISAVKGFALACSRPMMGITAFDLFADRVIAGNAAGVGTGAETAATNMAEDTSGDAAEGANDAAADDAAADDAADKEETDSPYIFYVVIDAGHDHFYVQGYEGSKVMLPACFLSGDTVRGFAATAPVYGFEDLPLENYTKLEPGALLEPAILSGRHEFGEIHAVYARKSQAEEARECR